MSIKRTPEEIMKELFKLACLASPENISCDGEASPSQIKQTQKAITQSWRALENELRQKVSRDEVFEWKLKEDKKKLDIQRPIQGFKLKR